MKIANAGNSCYMDSVLFSMFAIPAIPSPSLDEILTKAVCGEKTAGKLQLQRLISKNFMQPLRDNQVKIKVSPRCMSQKNPSPKSVPCAVS